MGLTINDIVNDFITYAKRFDKTAPNNSWYVGISRDPDTRKRQHEREKGIICEYFRPLVSCVSETDARKLEQRLNSVGFVITSDELEPIAMEAARTSGEYHVYIYHAVTNRMSR
jgi:NRPS condensation-like uncharacterized protein